MAAAAGVPGGVGWGAAGEAGYEQDEQARLWGSYLAQEAANPQRLALNDLTIRVQLAYEQVWATPPWPLTIFSA